MERHGVNRKVREAIVAGIFYPEDGASLMKAVDAALAGVAAEADGQDGFPIAILSPHAAFEFSVDVQAAAWKSAAGKPVDRVVMIAPLRRPSEAAAYLPESDRFITPLGDVLIDTEACEGLETCCTLFESNDIPHLEHHAIEVQLPFMKRLFPDACLVPILVGGDASVSSSLARAIDHIFREDMDGTLVVASSNLASSISAADADMRSGDILTLMAMGDWLSVADLKDLSGSTALAATMALAAVEGTGYRLLARSDSSRHNERINDRIVQYAAVAWYGRREKP